MPVYWLIKVIQDIAITNDSKRKIKGFFFFFFGETKGIEVLS